MTRKKHPRYDLWKDVRRRARRAGVRFGWETFEAFAEWCEPRWKPGLHLVRLDESDAFGPDNCVFLSHRDKAAVNAQQFTAFGESKSLRQWSEDTRCAVSLFCLRQRIEQLKWPIEMALATAEWSHIRRFHE